MGGGAPGCGQMKAVRQASHRSGMHCARSVQFSNIRCGAPPAGMLDAPGMLSTLGSHLKGSSKDIGHRHEEHLPQQQPKQRGPDAALTAIFAKQTQRSSGSSGGGCDASGEGLNTFPVMHWPAACREWWPQGLQAPRTCARPATRRPPRWRSTAGHVHQEYRQYH
jgi:hypothetical protein